MQLEVLWSLLLQADPEGPYPHLLHSYAHFIYKCAHGALPPTYRKWPQLLICTKNCIYQRVENFVIPAIMYDYQPSELM